MTSENPGEALAAALHHAAHLLPEQAPIHAFVHHNTLHAFEDLSFHQAAERAAEVLGGEPYPTEAAFARYVEQGNLHAKDVLSVVAEEFLRDLAMSQCGDLTFADFARHRLLTFFEVPSPEAVRWREGEEQHISAWHEAVSPVRQKELTALARSRYGTTERNANARLLQDLYLALGKSAPQLDTVGKSQAPRRRDQLLMLTRVDADALAHPLLIRLAAAYLDQGIAYWKMPDRSAGFYQCFRALYSQPAGAPDTWLRGLETDLARQSASNFSAEAACLEALERLQVPVERWSETITATLLSLRGWAGMFRQFEERPDKAPVYAVPARLIDFLAVALTLDACAAVHVLGAAGHLVDLSELRHLDRVVAERLLPRPAEAAVPDISAQFEAFVLAQVCSLDLTQLLDHGAGAVWHSWVSQLPLLKRRRLLLAAYEKNHLDRLTHGLTDHLRWLEQRTCPAPAFQAVFCIDDREESFRRHVEEVEPAAETFSYPGFFGVAMRFHGAEDYRHKDLCPVVLKPTHVIREEEPDGKLGFGLGSTDYHLHVGSKTLLRGLALSVMGLVSLFPLVLGVLFPRWFHLKRKKPTALRGAMHLERTTEPASGSLPEGYTPQEMSGVVKKVLTEIGLTRSFSPLVLIIGHGSSSINNPHLAAYGCGATAGGCGGPNARVLAGMANRSDVRALLQSQGIDIPPATRFVAGMHDTCTDDVVLYDAEVPDFGEPALRALVRAKEALAAASPLNALERCRLFGQVSLNISPARAKEVVEGRSVDLSEPRPEYNHAKNSCCVVGRRRWTRGLFLDQRAFLISYDPSADPEGNVLKDVLLGSVPVGMGINLEYFFSAIDQRAYGAGSKLPHNVAGLIGVMDGHASDLRTGLYAQMIELHEPVRLVVVVEAEPRVLLKIAAEEPRLGRLIAGGWLQLLAWRPEQKELLRFAQGAFHLVPAEESPLPTFASSREVFASTRATLPYIHVEASFSAVAS